MKTFRANVWDEIVNGLTIPFAFMFVMGGGVSFLATVGLWWLGPLAAAITFGVMFIRGDRGYVSDIKSHYWAQGFKVGVGMSNARDLVRYWDGSKWRNAHDTDS